MTGAVKVRLIPAHAGKTQIGIEVVARERAHPRACGENSKWTYNPQKKLGSSPRMRGKHVALDLGPVDGGLIPAHAGKTPSRP